MEVRRGPIKGAERVKVRHGPIIDYTRCSGQRCCYDNCPDDVFDWDEELGLPIVAYPDECHYCGICEIQCVEQAITVRLPLHAMLDLGIYPKI